MVRDFRVGHHIEVLDRAWVIDQHVVGGFAGFFIARCTGASETPVRDQLDHSGTLEDVECLAITPNIEVPADHSLLVCRSHLLRQDQ